METIIRSKQVSFLEENIMINNTQYSFHYKHSCLTNLFDYYNDAFNIYDETEAVDAIHLDFQKAFEKFPHKRLLKKLESHDISGNILKYLEDWLSEKQQRVVVNGKSSNWRDIISGVPQGSVLGPILFLIFVNGINESLSRKISNLPTIQKSPRE